jgi:hypothetical protein
MTRNGVAIWLLSTDPSSLNTGNNDPEDLRIDVAGMTGDGPCAVPVTYKPTGTTVTVDDHHLVTERNTRLFTLHLRRPSAHWRIGVAVQA